MKLEISGILCRERECKESRMTEGTGASPQSFDCGGRVQVSQNHLPQILISPRPLYFGNAGKSKLPGKYSENVPKESRFLMGTSPGILNRGGRIPPFPPPGGDAHGRGDVVAFPDDNVGDIDNVPYEQLSRGVSRFRCWGTWGRGVPIPTTDVGGGVGWGDV